MMLSLIQLLVLAFSLQSAEGAAPTRVPTRAPTKVPTRHPTHAPTSGMTTPTIIPTSSGPTRAPTVTPTITPTITPTKTPTREPTEKPSTVLTQLPTVPPTVSGEQQLFAIVGGSSCAENLYYGPESISESGTDDGKYQYYLSTNTASKNIPHTNWLQIVTSDGTTELFHIYWSFTTPKTLAERFIGAPSGSENVYYRVEVADTKDIYYFNAKWRFSNSASMSANKFNVAKSTCCFSADDGAWGAGSTTVDANGSGQYTAQFWGIGNWDASDTTCSQVYKNGLSYNLGAKTKTYMYYFAPVPPSAEPSAAPSFKPTIEPTVRPSTLSPTLKPTSAPTFAPSKTPTREPTVKPTSAPTFAATVPQLPGTYELFAVLTAQSCAEGLYYGPNEITTDGGVGGYYPAFLSTNTPNKDLLHTEWVQVVTTDGKNELFRIYWSFETPRTLADHFIRAVASGEKVSYRVVRKIDGAEFTYNGVWWFSNGAGNMATKFAVTSAQYGFSLDDGVWGAGKDAINGNGALYASVVFWGVGNWDSADVQNCYYIHTQGSRASYPNTKTYMYFETIPKPSGAPTAVPSRPTLVPSEQPTRVPTKEPTAGPTRAPTSTAPTRAPSCAPSKTPTREPTVKPTFAPTFTATVPQLPDTYQLFAVLTGQSCAEDLLYGPSSITVDGGADGTYPAFLSTSTPDKDKLHAQWVQIVTSDGYNEIFRIYWSFETPRTLANHFVSAVSVGEKVTYRVVRKADQAEFVYSGTWYFSNGASNFATKFAVTSIVYGFSGDDGAWGAGIGTINGNGGLSYLTKFWGVANWNTVDTSSCYNVYADGSALYYPSSKTYMYYSTVAVPSMVPTEQPTRAPTREPTTGPTRAPTFAPSRAPSREPTVKPTFAPSVAATVPELPGTYELFAVLTSSSCAEGLYYGPNPTYAAFVDTSTPHKDQLHTEWVQIVTSDGYNELFRIYWSFETPRTLANHFINAVASGEKVFYRVVRKIDGAEFTYNGVWWFSNGATSFASKFATPTVQYGFSSDDGAWGAGTGTINGNSGLSSLTKFWGVANWNAGDSTMCYNVYAEGVSTYYPNTKTYMYYSVVPIPSAAPTTQPTAPTRAPSGAPSTMPSRVPTSLAPTLAPSSAPSNTPPPFVNTADELFAVVGGNACAEQLWYGPLAITLAGTTTGNYEYYLSTSTSNKNLLHTKWTQIVTSDGVNELFRVYWTFATARTLNDHFYNAVNFGESVSFHVVEAGGQEYVYSGTWWFSNGANIASNAFSSSITARFSNDDGIWGGGIGTLNPNGNPIGYQGSQFWGIGNWDASDSGCSTVYRAGVPDSSYGASVKVYLFMTAVVGPTQLPTIGPSRPTAAPTKAPTSFPTRSPTKSPTRGPTRHPTRVPTIYSAPVSSPVPSNMALFAVIGGASCAENLFYGPQAITKAGSADGNFEYFLSTSAGLNAHREWLQVVTDRTTELYRIYWTFSSSKNIADRFATAVGVGESVSFRVVVAATGQNYYYSGSWRFSNGASITASKFTATLTSCCFSADDGAWGAGNSIIDGNSMSGVANTGNTFWGIANFDNADGTSCDDVYQNGVLTANTAKVYMYYNTVSVPTAAPTQRSPTMRPSRRPTNTPTYEPTVSTAVSMQAEQQVDGVSYSDYAADKAAFDKVFTLSIASSIAGVNVEDIKDLVVSAASRRTLSTATEKSEESQSLPADKEIGAVDTNYLRSNAGHRKRTTLNGAVNLRYTIEVARNRGLTYSQMASLLEESVTTNQFTAFLQIFADQENVPELRDATSSSVSTEETSQIQESDSSKESSGFTIELIVGLAVGVILVLFGIAYYMTYGAIVGEIYRCLCPCFANNNAANNQLQDLASLHNQASAPPLADPTISKDINLYFSGDLSIHNAPGGGNLVVTDDTSEQALNSGFSPRDVYSAHRPHTAQHSSEYPTGNEMSTIPQSPSSPSSNKPAALPVAALAVPVSHIVVHDADIAIAEVYLGEVEEYKE